VTPGGIDAVEGSWSTSCFIDGSSAPGRLVVEEDLRLHRQARGPNRHPLALASGEPVRVGLQAAPANPKPGQQLHPPWPPRPRARDALHPHRARACSSPTAVRWGEQLEGLEHQADARAGSWGDGRAPLGGGGPCFGPGARGDVRPPATILPALPNDSRPIKQRKGRSSSRNRWGPSIATSVPPSSSKDSPSSTGAARRPGCRPGDVLHHPASRLGPPEVPPQAPLQPPGQGTRNGRPMARYQRATIIPQAEVVAQSRLPQVHVGLGELGERHQRDQASCP